MNKRIMISVAVWAVGLLIGWKAMAGSVVPTNTPAPTMRTLDEVYRKALIYASPQTLSPTTMVMNEGYYQATTLTRVENHLTAGNIPRGVTLFGIMGTYSRTNRYWDRGDGTVKDQVTGLMWTKNANHGSMAWTAAVAYCESLVYAGYDDWRLPSVNQCGGNPELDTLGRPDGNPTNTPYSAPGNPFVFNSAIAFSSSVTVTSDTNYAWCWSKISGNVYTNLKTNARTVWPVRGP